MVQMDKLVCRVHATAENARPFLVIVITLPVNLDRHRGPGLSRAHKGARHDGMAVAAGISHSVAVSEDGGLFVWGSGHKGKLGTGNTGSRQTPARVTDLPAPVVQVAAGRGHTAIVTEDGHLLLCGAGDDGQLGLIDKADKTTPTLLGRALFENDAVLMVDCGLVHTAALTEGGSVYTFGAGWLGQLGHGNRENEQEPRKLPAALFNNVRIVMLAAGFSHTVALSEVGHIFTWGSGILGRLGHGNEERQLAPRQVDPARFGGEKVAFVAAGGSHTLAVAAGGHLYSWGYGEYGRLGHGDTTNRLVPTLVPTAAFAGSAVVMAACGGLHTMVVTHDGSLRACGHGGYGQLGMKCSCNRHVFELVGSGEFGHARIVTAAAGHYHSAAVTEDGALWTWGYSGEGCLGHGDQHIRRTPTLVPAVDFGGGRIGRCRALPEQYALAFAMGTHERLGAAADAHCSLLMPELVVKIARLGLVWPTGRAGEEEGLVRLLGGGAGAGAEMRRWPTWTVWPSACPPLKASCLSYSRNTGMADRYDSLSRLRYFFV